MQASVREQRDADRRARELYHYFQPDNPALLPPRDARVTFTASTVKSSPNLVLTALTQLAAVKLGVQRAIIRYYPFSVYMLHNPFLGHLHWRPNRSLNLNPLVTVDSVVTNDLNSIV